MKITKIVVGLLEENCYLLEKDDKIIIIDPGDEFAKIESIINNKKVIGVLITHHHNDHIGALKEVLKIYNLEEGVIKDNTFNYEVIKTPGHTADSLTYYFKNENIMFTGDFLFKGSIGRMDMPTGSKLDMLKSLEKISRYPNDIKIYPGHGEETVLGVEKENFEFYKAII